MKTQTFKIKIDLFDDDVLFEPDEVADALVRGVSGILRTSVAETGDEYIIDVESPDGDISSDDINADLSDELGENVLEITSEEIKNA